MTMQDLAAQRLYSQRLTRPDLAGPADVVRWLGAVQAQDFLGSLYGIGLRLAEATEQSVEKAIAAKAIVRTWSMRSTIHLVPPENARWMVKLLAHRRNLKLQGIHRRVGLTEATFARAGKVIARALRGGKCLARPEIYARLEDAGIKAITREQRGLHILCYWAQEGMICFGPRLGKQPTFTLLEEWIPAGRKLEGDEALAELAGTYFVGHGPATIQDFAWWSGLSMAEATRGVQAAEAKLFRQTANGRTYWSGPEARLPALQHPDVHLLPPYDEFTVAYKDRGAVLDPTRLREAGFGLVPSILVDGHIVGTWKRTRKKDSVIVDCTLLGALDHQGRLGLERAADRYGTFIGLPAVIRT